MDMSSLGKMPTAAPSPLLSLSLSIPDTLLGDRPPLTPTLSRSPSSAETLLLPLNTHIPWTGLCFLSHHAPTHLSTPHLQTHTRAFDTPWTGLCFLSAYLVKVNRFYYLPE